MTLPLPPGFELPTHRGHAYLPKFWEDHYTQLPEIYHRFALSTDEGVKQLNRLLPLASLRVLDLGSGTGRSAFAMAQLGAHVVGIDPSPEMREFALRLLAAQPGLSVEFLDGSTSRLPTGLASFDVVTSFHAPFAPEGRPGPTAAELDDLIASVAALLRPGGRIAVATVIPGWTHAWMSVESPSSTDQHATLADPGEQPTFDRLMRDAGFSVDDELLEYDYGSLAEALATYGFIYGPPAFDWLLARDSPVAYFGSRIYVVSPT